MTHAASIAVARQMAARLSMDLLDLLDLLDEIDPATLHHQDPRLSGDDASRVGTREALHLDPTTGAVAEPVPVAA